MIVLPPIVPTIMHRIPLLLLIPLPLLILGSCAGTDGIASSSAKLSALSRFSLGELRPARVQVVEVREKDLKAFPLGSERALAFHGSGFSGRRAIFDGPVNFIEPELPQAGPDFDGSLLPPLNN